MRGRPALPLVLGLALVLVPLAWGPTLLSPDFAFDDREAIAGNPVIEGALPVSEAFRRDYWHHLQDAGHYRPLATLSLRADRSRWGEWAAGYHLSNLGLHALVVLLAGVLALRYLKRPEAVLLGLTIFAVHPALSDSVAWISGRTSMLAVIPPLAAALLIAPSARISFGPIAWASVASVSALGLGLGLCGKEEALFLAPLLVLLARRHSRTLGWAASAGILVALGTVLLLRAEAIGQALPQAPFAPLGALPLKERLLFGGRAFVEALRLMWVPVHFPPNYRAHPGFEFGHPPGSWAWFGWAAWIGLALTALFVIHRTRPQPGGAAARRRTAAIGLLLALAAWAPFTGVIPAGEVFAPRFGYLPLLLLTPLVGLACLNRRAPALAALLALLVLGAWSSGTAYRDRASYARAILAHVPGDVGAWNDLGLALEERGDREGALQAWGQGLERDGDYARIWSNLGRLQASAGDLETAEASLRKAVLHSTSNPIARCNLGSVLLRRGAPREAAEVYAQATRIAPGMSAAWRGLANAQMRLGDGQASRRALNRALALDPSDALSLELRARIR